MPRRHVDPAVKAAATAEALAGGSSRAIGRKYAVSYSAVRLWRRYPYSHQKSEQVNARVFALMLEGLDTVAAHFRHARDADWLASQSAADLAAFDGVALGQLLGLVEAVRAAGDQPAESPEAGPEPPALPAPPAPDAAAW